MVNRLLLGLASLALLAIGALLLAPGLLSSNPAVLLLTVVGGIATLAAALSRRRNQTASKR